MKDITITFSAPADLAAWLKVHGVARHGLKQGPFVRFLCLQAMHSHGVTQTELDRQDTLRPPVVLSVKSAKRLAGKAGR